VLANRHRGDHIVTPPPSTDPCWPTRPAPQRLHGLRVTSCVDHHDTVDLIAADAATGGKRFNSRPGAGPAAPLAVCRNR
jgi:hypothetical protein